MRKGSWLVVTIVTGALAATGAQAANYKVDADHTTVGFRIRHLFSHVEGRFDRFEGTIAFDKGNPEATKVQGSIDVSGINTNVAERDKHLRSKDFFDVEAHPKIIFVSTQVSAVDKAKLTGKLHGDLTIRGVTKPVVLDVSFGGEGTDPWGNRKAGFSAQTTINRKDFGLNWNEVLETGGVLVGEEVQIRIDVEGGVAQ